MADEQDVRRLALELPATVERPSYGTPGFRVKDKLFARLHEEPGVLVLLERVCVEELRELLADAWRLRAPARLVAELDGVRRSTVAGLHSMGPKALRRLDEALAARGLART